MDMNNMPDPRMPPIKNLEFLDLVGVISSPCTTPSGRTAASATCRQSTTSSAASRHRNGTGRCAQSRAPVPLHHRANQAQMANRLYSSPDEKRSSGQ